MLRCTRGVQKVRSLTSACLPQSVVSAKTVEEFKSKLSYVDLSSFLRYTTLIVILVVCKWLCKYDPVLTIN